MKTQLDPDGKPAMAYERDACAREHPIPARKMEKKDISFKSETTRAVISAAAFQLNCKRSKNEIGECTIHEIESWISRKKVDLELPENIEKLRKIIQQKLPAYLSEYVDVFLKVDSDKLSSHRPGVDHKIELIKKRELRYYPLYSQSLQELETTKKYLKENLDKRFISLSSAPFAASILFVKKPNGGL